MREALTVGALQTGLQGSGGRRQPVHPRLFALFGDQPFAGGLREGVFQTVKGSVYDSDVIAATHQVKADGAHSARVEVTRAGVFALIGFAGALEEAVDLSGVIAGLPPRHSGEVVLHVASS